VSGAYPVLHLGSFGPAGPVSSARTGARTFRGTPASVPQARRFAAELLAGCPAREVLLICVSEFCTNAIMHTASGNGGVFTVEVDCPRDGVARVAVTDEGARTTPATPTARATPSPTDSAAPAKPSVPAAGALDLMAEGGRGLALVAACTSRWGYADAYPGRTVWAEACWPVGVPSPGQDQPGTSSCRSRSPIPPGDWPSGPAA